MTEEVITYQGIAYPDECDHMGHMNVAAYTRKFDEAVWVLWAGVGLTRAKMDAETCGLAALEGKINYKQEVYPGDALRVRSQFVGRSNRSATFRHRLLIVDADGSERLAAYARYTAACLDRNARRARPFPDDVSHRLDSAIIAGADVDPTQ